MANNRLYIEDTETGERFLLCKTVGRGWYRYFEVNKFDEWVALRDETASFGNCVPPASSKLRIVTENECAVKS